MDRSLETFATLAGGGLMGLVLAFAVTPGTAPAASRLTPPVVANQAAKQDRLDVADRTGAIRRTLPGARLVAQMEIQQGPAGAVVTLLDREGRVVYRSDPERQETTVTRGAVIPASLHGADGGPRLVTMQQAMRAARTDPEAFLAATLGDREPPQEAR